MVREELASEPPAAFDRIDEVIQDVLLSVTAPATPMIPRARSATGSWRSPAIGQVPSITTAGTSLERKFCIILLFSGKTMCPLLE
jgi:hypothetical protein